jgi:energy-coupling factor transporter transmembrane protein EcfT
MILRLLATLIISTFLFINRTVTFAGLFFGILVIFSIIYKAKLRGKFLKMLLISSMIIFIFQILFRKGNIPIFQIWIIKIYPEAIKIGINVGLVFLSMVFIIGILRTLDEEIIFSTFERTPVLKFLKIPLYTAYRFLPVISYQAMVMNFHAVCRLKRNKKNFFKIIRVYQSLLVPFFVSVFKRIFYMSLSVERRGIEKVKYLFEKKKDVPSFIDIVYLVFSLCFAFMYIFFSNTVVI